MNKDDTKKTGNAPVIYPGSLNDQELIKFLEELSVSLQSRSRLAGKPVRLREEASIAEERLSAMNEAIDLIVCRHTQAPSDAETQHHQKKYHEHGEAINNNILLDAALQQQLTTAGQRIKIMAAISEALTNEGKKLGIKGIRKEELEQIFSAISLITEIK
ncbi:hypothetical protein [Brenneria tiliae]|uniref:Uncharacterized protein n=1 Tax=Brenneria tiliae TaxID=2914984 RepID=A0ABT0MWR5_9GAMM|nr:hypothetical protein [Brenneria tiliae]MCL2894284.1 hypothetical protein [Brenneria tiliae]